MKTEDMEGETSSGTCDHKEELEDSFAYLKRNFSSENYKIEIRGLPKFHGIGQLKKLLNSKLQLNCSKIKPPKKNSKWIYVCFRSEDDRTRAIEKLNGFVWKKKVLTAQPASAIPDPLVQKRNQRKQELTQSSCHDTDMKEVGDTLKANIVPLWNIPYEKQLQIKMETMHHLLQKMGKEIKFCNQFCPSARIFLDTKFLDNENLPCSLERIKHAPEESFMHSGYRNKCEFTIGKNSATGRKTVGFRFGSYINGTTDVGSAQDMPHVTSIMKSIAKKLEIFIQDSKLDVYNPENHQGFWKELMVRHGTRTDEVMVVVVVNMNGTKDEELDSIKSELVALFIQDNVDVHRIDSLYLRTAYFTSDAYLYKS